MSIAIRSYSSPDATVKILMAAPLLAVVVNACELVSLTGADPKKLCILQHEIHMSVSAGACGRSCGR